MPFYVVLLVMMASPSADFGGALVCQKGAFLAGSHDLNIEMVRKRRGGEGIGIGDHCCSALPVVITTITSTMIIPLLPPPPLLLVQLL